MMVQRMKKRTKNAVVKEYLARANGDALKALKWAVEDLGRVGYAVSSGYVRAIPYSAVQPPHEEPPSVDIPGPDENE